MVNYGNSKIYKIEAINGDTGDVYIGSTTKKYLSQRMDKHRSEYIRRGKGKKVSHVSAYDIFDKYGIENCQITLIEKLECESKDELRAREGFYIKSIKCVNKLIAGRTHKEYYNDNKEEISQKAKVEYEKKKDKIKDYRDGRKEIMKEYNKKYIQENKDKIKLKCEEKHECECGGRYTHANKAQHSKSAKHQNYYKI